MAARALSQQKHGDEDEDPFSFVFGSGGDNDDEFDILSAFGGFGGEGGNDEEGEGFDFFSSAFGGFGGEDEDESGGGLDFFSSAFGGMGMGSMMGMAGEDDTIGDIMENMEHCGIDVADMATKALGAFFTISGPEMDFSSPESYQAIAPVLVALKDDEEDDCERAEIDKMMFAFEEYLKCIGMSFFELAIIACILCKNLPHKNFTNTCSKTNHILARVRRNEQVL